MASLSSKPAILFCSIISFFFIIPLTLSEAQTVPAIYVLGDSLVDVGNNNYIPLSLLKADYPHNGIDYAGRKPTGRFCNGKNSADFIAEKVGLPTSPPYLANKNDVFLKGASFASGGAGIFNATGQGFLLKCLPLTKQVDYFALVQRRLAQNLGAAAAQNHLEKSIFTVVIGSNDLSSYFSNDTDKLQVNVPPQQFVDEMISILRGQLQRLHSLGARKLVVIGVAPLGCTPGQRQRSSTEDCNSELNNWTIKYNQQLASMLEALKSELNDISYSYFDTYSAFLELIEKPATYGFNEVKAACCGLGKLNADVYCTPFSTYCPNRRDHIFWDRVHPTQAADEVLVDMIFSGRYVSPMTLMQLIAL